MAHSHRRAGMVFGATVALAGVMTMSANALDFRSWMRNESTTARNAVKVEWGGKTDGMLRVNVGPPQDAVIIRPDDRVGYRHWVVDDPVHGQMCLEVNNGGTYQAYVRLSRCGDVVRQQWTATSAKHSGLKPTNEFTGPNLCLDSVVGGRDDGYLVMMPCSDVRSQAWFFEKP